MDTTTNIFTPSTNEMTNVEVEVSRETTTATEMAVTETGSRDSMVITEIELSKIRSNPNNARTTFDENEMEALIQSIKEDRLMQPVQLRKIGDDEYEVFAGERRFRAFKRLERITIPAIVRNIDEKTAEMLGLAENIIRSNLKETEKARKFHILKKRYGSEGVSVNEMAKLLGRSESYLRHLGIIAELSEDKQRDIETGKISGKDAVAEFRAEKKKKKAIAAGKPINVNSPMKKQSIADDEKKAKSDTSPLTADAPSSKENKSQSIPPFNDFRQSILEMVDTVLKIDFNNVNIELMTNKQLSEIADCLGDATVRINNLYDTIMQEQNDRESLPPVTEILPGEIKPDILIIDKELTTAC